MRRTQTPPCLPAGFSIFIFCWVWLTPLYTATMAKKVESPEPDSSEVTCNGGGGQRSPQQSFNSSSTLPRTPTGARRRTSTRRRPSTSHSGRRSSSDNNDYTNGSIVHTGYSETEVEGEELYLRFLHERMSAAMLADDVSRLESELGLTSFHHHTAEEPEWEDLEDEEEEEDQHGTPRSRRGSGGGGTMTRMRRRRSRRTSLNLSNFQVRPALATQSHSGARLVSLLAAGRSRSPALGRRVRQVQGERTGNHCLIGRSID